MNGANQCGGDGLIGRAGGPVEGTAKVVCDPTPQQLIRDRAQSLRREADRLDILANSLPGVMPMMANDALIEIILRRPIF